MLYIQAYRVEFRIVSVEELCNKFTRFCTIEMGEKMIQFDAYDIDNSAIHIVIDQLVPYLKHDPDSEHWVINEEQATAKHRVLYESILIPYFAESKEHFYAHHYDSPTTKWCGEQACLSMIYAINQKAWWLLYYFAIKDAVEAYGKVPESKIDVTAHEATSYIIDGNRSIKDTIHTLISNKYDHEESNEKLMIDDISQTIQKYKETPSYPMIYR